MLDPVDDASQNKGHIASNQYSVTSKRVLLNDKLVPATLYIQDGKITRIERASDPASDRASNPNARDYGNYVIMPGLVDTHVHLSETGGPQVVPDDTSSFPPTDDWEGFETGTKAAAAGGVTSIVDMPLNGVPPTTTLENFELKLKAAKDQCWVDVGFWGGVIPGNTRELVPMIQRGVLGFKCFLMQGLDPYFPMVTMAQAEEAMAELEGHPTVLLFHAEIESGCHHNHHHHHDGDVGNYDTFLQLRPDKFETDAIEAIADAATRYPDLRLHIVHLATAKALPTIRGARERGSKLSVETCFHYLAFHSESIPRGAVLYKVVPPIRSQSDQQQLWQALADGDIDCVVSDHSPCTPALKDLDRESFVTSWAGITSVGLGLVVLWTAAEDRGVSLPQISKWVSLGPARQAGIDRVKGSLEVGKDADFVVFDPEVTGVFDASKMHFRNKLTVYDGMPTRGRVIETVLRGRTVFRYNEPFSAPQGKLLLHRDH